MEKLHILGTGLTGLVGSRIVELLHDTYEFENISRSTGVDITHAEQVEQAVAHSPASVILHLAAKADVDGCETDKVLGEDGEAWKINVMGTSYLAQAAARYNKKLIYISTDFVFDGEKEFYTEEDTPHPLNWYGQTKYEGEKVVQSLASSWIVVRPAYPYRAEFPKNDFMRAVKRRLEQHQPVQMVTDHIFTPTFIDDLAGALDTLITQKAEGIYHVVGSESLTPFQAAEKIAKVFSLDSSLIGQTTRSAYFSGKAERPFRLALKNAKIEQLNVRMRTFSEGLEDIKKQLEVA